MAISGTSNFNGITVNFDTEFAKLKGNGGQNFQCIKIHKETSKTGINKLKFLERASSDILIKVYNGANFLYETHNTQDLKLPDNANVFIFSKQKSNVIVAQESFKINNISYKALQGFYKQQIEPKLSSNTQIHTALYNDQDNLVAESYGELNFDFNALSQQYQKLNILVESIQIPAE
jgi:spore germination protein YaaH